MIELDEITLRCAAKGNPKAFKSLYGTYSNFVWKVLFRTVNGDRDAAEQIMQDVFIKVYKSLKSFKFNAAFSTWLYRITYNETLTYLKNKQMHFTRNVNFNDTISDRNTNDVYENHELVSQLLQTLEPEQRFLLIAREVNDIPFEELAQIMGQNSGALRTQLYRIKEHIREEWAYERKNSVQEVV